MMTRPWVVVVVVVVLAIVQLAASVVPPTCPWIEYNDDGCVRDAECSDNGNVIIFWEDCGAGEELFTITDAAVALDSSCSYASGDRTITLTAPQDAEEAEILSCTLSDSSGTIPNSRMFFSPQNVNESPPHPTSGTNALMEVSVDENAAPGVLATIYYKDDDKGETGTLTCAKISGGDEFELTALPDLSEGGDKVFELKTTQAMDFESMMFAKVEFNIISRDERGTEKSTKQTFLVSVVDKPDEPPFWNSFQPFYNLEECAAGVEVFQVIAQDRDVMVNYDIKYSMTEATAEEYFSIDEVTGMLSTSKVIDREALLVEGIRSFTLLIKATEYKPSGEVGEEPNSSEQTSIIYVMDINDNIPVFDKESYQCTIDELTSQDYILPLDIVVMDMDEGDNGSYTLTTSDSSNLEVTSSGQGEQAITLTALWRGDNTLFNYELQSGSPLEFEIVATEVANSDHSSTVTVTVTMNDVNDNRPNFTKPAYHGELPENSPVSTELLVVAVTDEDISSAFNEDSVRYSLESTCTRLSIDNITGVVTLAKQVDYENEVDRNFECMVVATDEEGEGLSSYSTITVTVLDVIDEPPMFNSSVVEMSVAENSKPDTLVGTLTVTDYDASADITFTVDSITPDSPDIAKWFKVVPLAPAPPIFKAEVRVGEASPDNEVADTITLSITATDQTTEEGANAAKADAVITITSVNDEKPVFVGDYKGLKVKENVAADTTVFILTVTDKDASDVITLTISDASQVYLSTGEVSVEGGDEVDVEVKVTNGGVIDREQQDVIKVIVTLADSADHSSEQEFTINIIDVNDNVPMLEEGSCGNVISVSEDAANGTVIYQLVATDGDAEAPHNSIVYAMQNDYLPDPHNQMTPFTVNPANGEVKVLLNGDQKKLDRETYDTWELYFLVYDQCKEDDPDCHVLWNSDRPCFVTVHVTDANDNAPRDLTWEPSDPVLQTTEFLKEGETLTPGSEYIFIALDDDIGENARLNYTVLSTTKYPDASTDLGLFVAKNGNNFGVDHCSLVATMDFFGKDLRGHYKITFLVQDQGTPPLSSELEVDLEILDCNDQQPTFEFSGCVFEDANFPVITMEELYYQPAEGEAELVLCNTDGGRPLIIGVLDNDLGINQEVKVKIDGEKSTVEDAADGNGQLDAFVLLPDDCNPSCNLYVTQAIERQYGSAYNLSLHVKDQGKPPLESWSTLRVVVLAASQYPPYFCQDPYCTQSLSMKRNDPYATVEFMEATDEDGDGNLYYYIVGGDTDDFMMTSSTSRTIGLRDKPAGLSREGKDLYFLKVDVTRSPLDSPPLLGHPPRNFTLYLTIHVEDNVAPTFPDEEIVAHFTESDPIGKTLFTIKADDPNQEEFLTYTIMDDLQWHNTYTPSEEPFIISRKDDMSAYVKLNFDPSSVLAGYCTFTMQVFDQDQLTATIPVRVLAVNTEEEALQ